MAKTICDWSKKEIKQETALLHELTQKASHYCRKCGRVANTPEVLCKGKKFKKIKKEGSK